MQGQDGENTASEVRDEVRDTPKQQIGILFIILGWIFFAISVLFLPAFFGAGTILMGALVKRSGREKHGVLMMIMGVVGVVIGFTLGAIG